MLKWLSLILVGLIFMVSGCDEKIMIVDTPTSNIYGSMYSVNESGYSINLITTDVYLNLSNMSVGLVNGMNFVNPYLNVSVGGKYKIDWGVSFSTAVASTYGLSVGVNGVKSNACYTHRTTSNNAIGNVGGTCILQLNVNDKITLVVGDEGGVVIDPNIFMSNLAMMRVGN